MELHQSRSATESVDRVAGPQQEHARSQNHQSGDRRGERLRNIYCVSLAATANVCRCTTEIIVPTDYFSVAPSCWQRRFSAALQAIRTLGWCSTQPFTFGTW